MNRFLQGFNFVGVCALAVLCAMQWSTNSDLNLQIDALMTTLQNRDATIAAQKKTLQEQSDDLADLRNRLWLAEKEQEQTQTKLDAAVISLNAAIAQRNDLLSALQKWKAAVAERDAALKQANLEIEKSLADRNDAVQKYNDLANKYNALVKSLLAKSLNGK